MGKGLRVLGLRKRIDRWWDPIDSGMGRIVPRTSFPVTEVIG